jgi:hypothetical protein
MLSQDKSSQYYPKIECTRDPKNTNHKVKGINNLIKTHFQ